MRQGRRNFRPVRGTAGDTINFVIKFEKYMENNKEQNWASVDDPAKNKKWRLMVAALITVALITVAGLAIWRVSQKEPVVDQNSGLTDNSKTEVNDPEKEAVRGRLFLEISSEAIQKGDKFTVMVYGDTRGYDMSAVGFILLYNKEQLALAEKIDFGGSMMTIGAIGEDREGEIEVVRGQPGDGDWKDSDDGFNSDRGLLAKLTFEAKNTGEGEINFRDEGSSFILDDARGTEVKMDYAGVKYTIK